MDTHLALFSTLVFISFQENNRTMDSEDEKIFSKLHDKFKSTEIVNKFRYLMSELDKNRGNSYPHVEIEIHILGVLKEPIFIGSNVGGNCLQTVISRNNDIELVWKKRSLAYRYFVFCNCDCFDYERSLFQITKSVLSEVCLIAESLGMPYLGRLN